VTVPGILVTIVLTFTTLSTLAFFFSRLKNRERNNTLHTETQHAGNPENRKQASDKHSSFTPIYTDALLPAALASPVAVPSAIQEKHVRRNYPSSDLPTDPPPSSSPTPSESSSFRPSLSARSDAWPFPTSDSGENTAVLTSVPTLTNVHSDTSREKRNAPPVFSSPLSPHPYPPSLPEPFSLPDSLLEQEDRIWNIPPPCPRFTGREAHLAQLLLPPSAGRISVIIPRLTTMHEQGGIGKTQLALAYAARVKKDMHWGWRLRAHNRTVLLADYIDLGEELGLPIAPNNDHLATLALVRSTLAERTPPWLLIFDDVVQSDDIVDLLPPSHQGRIIITSRDPLGWVGIAEPHELPVFPRKQSTDYLQRNSQNQQQDRKKDPEAENTVHALAELLGDLPLALEHARSYMESTGTSLSACLEALLSGSPPLTFPGPGVPRHSKIVHCTTRLSAKSAARHSTAAWDLLETMAWLAPDDIPDTVFATFSHRLGEEGIHDTTAFDQLAGTVERFGLTQRSPVTGTSSLHPLTQNALRAGQKKKAMSSLSNAIDLIADAYPDESWTPATWAVCSLLTPHALTLASHAFAHDISSVNLAELLHNTGVYLFSRYTDCNTALHCLDQTLTLEEQVHEPNHPEIGVTLGNLSRIAHRQGQFERALAYQERALQVNETAYGHHHLEVAIALGNLGVIEDQLGLLDRARTHHRRALTILEHTRGAEHPDIAIAIGNLGIVEHRLGLFEEAKTHIRLSYTLNMKVYGEHHPEVAISLINLGLTERATGNTENAASCFHRANELLTEAYGPNHPDTRKTAQLAANLDRQRGNPAADVLLSHTSPTSAPSPASSPTHP